MPNKSKDTDKNHGKRPRSSDSHEAEAGDSRAPKKKKSVTTNKPAEGIAKSRQLAEKLHRTRSTRGPVARKSEVRICGNGKPMPSLSELERMFDDSDDDAEETTPTSTRCRTPEQPPTIADDKLISPNTIKHIATKMMDMLNNFPTINLDDDGPPPPVIPQKKRKKSDTPYIDGCKDRPQVEWRPKTRFGQGGTDYGVDNNPDPNEDEDDSTCPKKRKKNSNTVNVSKSIFNAKSDEIAARLKSNEIAEKLKQSDGATSPGNDSSDSNKTVDYNFNTTFSPLPSTSRDNKTILINDQRFKESFKVESNLENSLQNDVEIIESPCEIVEVDDTLSNGHAEIPQPMIVYTDDDCCIVEPSEDTNTTSPVIDAPKDEFYGSLNLNQNYDNDVCEIINVDDVIAENQAIIKKYHTKNSMDTVTLVEPGTSYTSVQPQGGSQSNNNDFPVFTGTSHLPNGNEVGKGNDMSIMDSSVRHIVRYKESDRLINEQLTIDFELLDTPNSATVDILVSDSIVITSDPRNVPGIIDQCLTNNRNGRGRSSGSSNQVSNANPHSNFVVTNVTSHSVPANNNNQSNHNEYRNRTAPHSTTPQKEPEQNITPQSGRDCPICLDSLSNKAAASTLCGHIFCMNCIKAAFRSNGKRCPTCRKGLKGVGYHQLFL